MNLTFKNFKSNEDGVAFGLFLLFALIVIALFANAMINDIYTPTHDAFDDGYRDTYLTSQGKSTVAFLEIMIGGAAFFMILIFGVIMVFNRSILKGEL